MQATDRTEFEKLLGELCAAAGVPLTQARKDGYWKAFHTKTLAQFASAIDLALQDDELDGMPSAHALKRMRRSQGAVVATQVQDDRDHLLYFANRLVLRWMFARGGFGSTGTFKAGYGMTDCVASALLRDIRRAVLDLVKWFRQPILEGDLDATPQAFIEMLVKDLGKVATVDAATIAAWKGIKGPAFEAHMVRDIPELKPQQELLPA